MTALFASIIPLIVQNVPVLVDKIKSMIDTAHQNKELTDEEHSQLIAAFIAEVQTDPAWQPSPDFKP